jgi:enoyl-CoA hydratase
MNPETYEFLRITIEHGVGFVELNRPEKLNACRTQDHAELSRMLREAQSDEAVACVIITGAGRAFCAGGDFSMVEQNSSDQMARLRTLEEARELVHAHLDLEKPVIAAINGVAVGAGAALALLCDFTIAERSARIADGHVPMGLAAGDGGMLTWPLASGMAKAKRYLLTGDFITAEEAERIGLITEVVADGESVPTARALAARLVAMPQTAMRYTKRALNQQLRATAMQSFELSIALEMLSKNTGESAATMDRVRAGGKIERGVHPGRSGAQPESRPNDGARRGRG